MKKLISIILSISMAITVGCIVSGCGNDELLQRLDSLQAELQTQSGKIDGLQVGLQTQGEKIDELQTQNTQLTEKLKEMQTALDEQAQEIEKLKLKTAQGNAYTIEEAYDNGFLTIEDLKSIAYYHNDGIRYNEEIMDETYMPAPKIPKVLSEGILINIKNAVVKNYNETYNQDKSLKDFMISEYYGIYNNFVIVFVVYGWMQVAVGGGTGNIGGVRFCLGPLCEIYAYKI